MTAHVVIAMLVVLISPGMAKDGDMISTDQLMKQGSEFLQRGDFAQAAASWKEAAQQYEKSGRVKERAQALLQLAYAYQALGQAKNALQTLELALALARQTEDPGQRATILAALGKAYLDLGQFDESAEHLNQAFAMARETGDKGLTGSVLNDMGVLFSVRQQYGDALGAYAEAASLAQAAQLPSLAMRAGANAALAATKLGRYAEAKERLDQAWTQAKGQDASHEKAYGMLTLGLAYSDLRPHLPQEAQPLLLQAFTVLNEAAAVAGQMGDVRTQSYAWGYLGHLYETEHRYGDATRLTRQAMFAAQETNAPESLYRWQWQLGRIFAALGDLDEAIAMYGQAAVTLQPLRPELSYASDESHASSRGSIRPLYFELADLLLKRAALTEQEKDAERYVLQAREAVELLKAAELREYFRDDCVDALQGRITSLDMVSPTAAVIYPIVFPDRLELLVSQQNRIRRVEVPVTADVLTKEVRTLRRLLEKRTTHEYLPHAQQVYDWVIRPFENELGQSIDTLVFVPDGPLRTIPMAVLHDGTQFLINKYAVANTPGLSLTDPRPINRQRIKVLSTGLTESVQGFPPLPHVSVELLAIRKLYGGDQLVNKEFIIPSLEKELKEGQFTIVHIASHGQFKSNVDQTFLLTFDDRVTMAKLDEFVGLFRFRDDPLDLLTLSACQTAVGDDRAALGLAGVGIKAGARSAVATLWFINDEASSTLMAEFYRQLQSPSISKAIALQRAQQKLLDDPVYQHPAYWAPFLLLNNWL